MINQDFSVLMVALATLKQNEQVMSLLTELADIRLGRQLGLNKPYIDLDDLLRDPTYKSHLIVVKPELQLITRSALWQILVVDRQLRAFHPERTEQLLAMGVKPMILGVSNEDAGTMYLDLGSVFI